MALRIVSSIFDPDLYFVWNEHADYPLVYRGTYEACLAIYEELIYCEMGE